MPSRAKLCKGIMQMAEFYMCLKHNIYMKPVIRRPSARPSARRRERPLFRSNFALLRYGFIPRGDPINRPVITALLALVSSQKEGRDAAARIKRTGCAGKKAGEKSRPREGGGALE